MREVVKLSSSAFAGLNLELSYNLLTKVYDKKGIFVVSLPSFLRTKIERSLDLAKEGSSSAIDEIENFISSFQTLKLKSNKNVENSLEEIKEILGLAIKIKEIYPSLEGRVYLAVETIFLEFLKEYFAMKGLNNVKTFHGHEVGIISDTLAANEIMIGPSTFKSKSFLETLNEDDINLIGSLTASTADNKIVKVQKGGSDIIASILSVSLDAKRLWVWTGVKGLMTADPQVLQDAKKIENLSYNEAIEIFSLNPTIFNPKAMDLIKAKGIELFIKNINEPYENGTKISGERHISSNIVKAVVHLENLSIITLIGSELRPILSNILSALSHSGVNFYTIIQSTSGSEVNLIVDKKDLNKLRNLIEIHFMGEKIQDYRIVNDVCAISIIGEGMKGTPGVASRLFGAVAREGINVIMIIQGSSELNIGFVINSSDCQKALRAVHKEFIR